MRSLQQPSPDAFAPSSCDGCEKPCVYGGSIGDPGERQHRRPGTIAPGAVAGSHDAPTTARSMLVAMLLLTQRSP